MSAVCVEPWGVCCGTGQGVTQAMGTIATEVIQAISWGFTSLAPWSSSSTPHGSAHAANLRPPRPCSQFPPAPTTGRPQPPALAGLAWPGPPPPGRNRCAAAALSPGPRRRRGELLAEGRVFWREFEERASAATFVAPSPISVTRFSVLLLLY